MTINSMSRRLRDSCYTRSIFAGRRQIIRRILIPLLFFVFTIVPPKTGTGQEKAYPEYGIYDTDLLPPSFYKLNRERFMRFIGDTSVAVFVAASEHTRNADETYRYRQNDNFFHLTGCNEPNSLLLLVPAGITVTDSSGSRRVREILFVMPRDPKQETWTGKRLGTEGAVSALGFESALPNTEFKSYLLAAFTGAKTAYVPLKPEGIEGTVREFISQIDDAEALFGSWLEFRDPNHILSVMRMVKSPEELAVMKTAAGISAGAIEETIKRCKPGMYEYQLASIFDYTCGAAGAEDLAFATICGSGENSTILHYESNRKRLQDGDVVVMDCGCEYHNYASDITRTFPVNGRFSEAQLEIYSIVLAAHDSAIAAMRPGTKYYSTVGAKGLDAIKSGLLKIGIIKTPEEYGKYSIHSIGHPVGLDVHDVMTDDSLTTGEIWTVEPGIYIPANTPGVDPKYWNIGIRIEDDVLITESGHEVITAAVPVKPDAIERLMKR